MAPPSYAALGKQAKDVFSKGYHFGLWKLDCKTTTASGIELTTAGQSVQDSGKVSGSLETKYNVKEYGVTFTEKWNTDNTLNTEVLFKDLAPGLKLSIEGLFAPQTNTKSGKLKVGYGQDVFQIDGDVNFDLNGPLINGAAVLGHQGFLLGCQAGYDTHESKVTSNGIALGFKGANFEFLTNITNGEDFNASYYHNFSDKVDGAAQVSYLSASEETKFGVGAVYHFCADACFHTKINNTSQLGLGYKQLLREGMTLCLSTLIDGKDLNSGAHKIGIALELSA